VHFRSYILPALIILVSGTTYAQELLLTSAASTVASEATPPQPSNAPPVAVDPLPPPLAGLKRVTSLPAAQPVAPIKVPAPIAPAAAHAAAQVEPPALLPPITVVEQLPAPALDVSAIPPVGSVPEARLVRGKEVVALSNNALRDSGVFPRALANSPQLAQSAAAVQTFQARVQTLEQQLAREREKYAQKDNQVRVKQEAQKRAHALNAASGPNAPQVMAPTDAEVSDLAREADFQAAVVAAVRDERDRQRSYLDSQESTFEQQLWNVGLNGAKVGRVTSTNQAATAPANDEPDRYIMIKPLGASSSDNLGYTRTRVYHNGEFGWRTVPAEYLLPLPVEQNDVLYPKWAAGEKQRNPDGTVIPITQDDTINPIAQFTAFTQGYYLYDTGFVDPTSANFSEGVALGGHHARGAGQSFVSTYSGNDLVNQFNVNLAVNTQIADVGGGNAVQAFAIANNDFNNKGADLACYGLRAYNRESGSPFEGWSAFVGKKQSIFGELSATPVALRGDRNLVGTVNRRNSNIPDGADTDIDQLGLTIPFSDYVSWSGSIEDPEHLQTDVAYTSTATIQKLNRWPTLASNVNFHNEDRTDLLQLGALIRSNGYEPISTGQEVFATGWGLSGIVQLRSGTSMYYAGVAGGDGRYIVGVPRSAVADPATNSIESLAGVGTFTGYEHWFQDACNNSTGVLSVAYGYAFMEDPGVAFLTENQKLHQAWVNYTRFIGDRVAVGVQYEYGFRQEASAKSGEDHRFMLVLTINTTKKEDTTKTDNNLFSAPSLCDGGTGGTMSPSDTLVAAQSASV
jgi:hypothetical protein